MVLESKMAKNSPKLPPFRLGIHFVIGMIQGFILVALTYFVISFKPDRLVPCYVHIACMIIYGTGLCFAFGYLAELRHHIKKLERLQDDSDNRG